MSSQETNERLLPRSLAEAADYLQARPTCGRAAAASPMAVRSDRTRQRVGSRGHASGLHAEVGKANLSDVTATSRERSHSRHDHRRRGCTRSAFGGALHTLGPAERIAPCDPCSATRLGLGVLGFARRGLAPDLHVSPCGTRRPTPRRRNCTLSTP